MRAAMGVYETGQVGAFGHTTAFVGQLGLVQPFLWLSGGQPWAFTAFGLVMAGLGIACTYLLARRYLGIGSAVMVVLLVLAFPGFARSSASFMTDVPTYALMMLCLLLGTRSGDDGWARASLVAAVAVGVLATSIREFALAAPLAVLIAAWVRSWPRHRALALSASRSCWPSASSPSSRSRRRCRGTAGWPRPSSAASSCWAPRSRPSQRSSCRRRCSPSGVG